MCEILLRRRAHCPVHLRRARFPAAPSRWAPLLTCATLLAGSAAQAPAPAGADAGALAAHLNRFAAAVAGALPAEGDLCWSPASAAMALLMAAPGARGETAAELARALAPEGWTPERTREALAEVRAWIARNRGESGFQLASSQDLWAQSGFALRPAFLAALRATFGTEPHAVDFRRDPAGARRTINAEIARRTGDRIRELLRNGDVDEQTRAVLTDALWLKAEWRTPFDPGATRDRPFVTAAGEQRRVPTMLLEADLEVTPAGGLQVVRLCYRGGDFALDLALPESADALPDALRALLVPGDSGWPVRLAPEKVIVTLPRFRIEYRRSLRSATQAAGVRLAFSERADFGGMTDDPRGLILGDLLQQTWFDVAEKGTEAAAATAGVMAPGAAAVPVARPRPIAFDRPFAFALRELRTGLVLFAGRCTDPRLGAQ